MGYLKMRLIINEDFNFVKTEFFQYYCVHLGCSIIFINLIHDKYFFSAKIVEF